MGDIYTAQGITVELVGISGPSTCKIRLGFMTQKLLFEMRCGYLWHGGRQNLLDGP
jgi:hypothetical protein